MIKFNINVDCTIILTFRSKNKIKKGVISIDPIYNKNYDIRPCITNNILKVQIT